VAPKDLVIGYLNIYATVNNIMASAAAICTPPVRAFNAHSLAIAWSMTKYNRFRISVAVRIELYCTVLTSGRFR
jgi:hypothetical protein